MSYSGSASVTWTSREVKGVVLSEGFLLLGTISGRRGAGLLNVKYSQEMWPSRLFLRSHVLVILGSAGMDVSNLLEPH